jgi:hypothetical protein
MYQRRRPALRRVCALTGAPSRLSYRGGADAEGSGTMSGSQQKGDRGLCWNCGKLGSYLGSWRMTCSGCEVSWTPWGSAPRDGQNLVCWMGTVIDCVDFTKPEALGAPA